MYTIMYTLEAINLYLFIENLGLGLEIWEILTGHQNYQMCDDKKSIQILHALVPKLDMPLQLLTLYILECLRRFLVIAI